MIPFPNISPEIFSITLFGVTFALRWYALSYICGFICALQIMKFFVNREAFWLKKTPPISSELADSIITYLIIGVIVGGRLGYVLFYNLEYYVTNPISILRIWDGGMSFHGGFIGVIFAVIIFSRANDIPLWSTADLIAVATPPGLFFGRVANFVNSELWGRPTEMFWGVIFPGERAQQCESVEGLCARHPTQLYEAGLEGILLFLILIYFALNGKFKTLGFLTGVFALGYGISRFIVEYFRVPDPQFFSAENPYGFALNVGAYGLTMGQLLSLPMVLVGIILCSGWAGRKKKNSYDNF
tara:strand:+ start:1301 stop:2197 length:897 start_codon:yes stop_codon:yes gene_type:complete